jgi:hypothetical protein
MKTIRKPGVWLASSTECARNARPYAPLKRSHRFAFGLPIAHRWPSFRLPIAGPMPSLCSRLCVGIHQRNRTYSNPKESANAIA